MPDRSRDMRIFRFLSTSPASRLKSNVKRIIPKKMVQNVLRPIMYLFT
jgi:hypothetical protein